MSIQLVPATDTAPLPPEYLHLEPLLDWALETEDERHAKRLSCTVEATRVLYDAMAPEMDAIIQLLCRIPRSQALSVPERNLYLLALSFVEVSMPIELEWPNTRNDGNYDSTRLHRPHRP